MIFFIFSKVLLAEESFDFGNALKSYVYSHKFWIKNTGEDTVKVISVRPTCGCSTAPLENDTIPPNDSVYVKFIFDSKGFSGFKKKHAYISITSAPTFKISILINLLDDYQIPFKIIPPIARLRSKEDTVLEKIIKIKNLTEKEFKLKVIAFDQDLVKDVKLKDPGLEGNGVQEVILKIIGKKGNENGCVTIEASRENKAYRFTIPVLWERRD